MIAKSTRGASPRAIARYVHGAGRGEEHVNLSTGEPGGEVIGGTLARVGTSEGDGWARTIERVCARREGEGRRHIEKPVYQVSLSLAPEDRALERHEWNEAVRIWLEAQGLDEFNTPYVVVQHSQRHVHVVLSRVGFDGEVWKGYRDFYRNEDACRAIEARFGLRKLPDRGERIRQGRSSHERLDRGARATLARTGQLDFKERSGAQRAVRANLERLMREHPRTVLPEVERLREALQQEELIRRRAPQIAAEISELEPQIKELREHWEGLIDAQRDARWKLKASNPVTRPFRAKKEREASQVLHSWCASENGRLHLKQLEKRRDYLVGLPDEARANVRMARSDAITGELEGGFFKKRNPGMLARFKGGEWNEAKRVARVMKRAGMDVPLNLSAGGAALKAAKAIVREAQGIERGRDLGGGLSR